MAITSDDYRRQAREILLAEATPEERLKGLDPEERLKGLDPEERLKGMEAEEIAEILKSRLSSSRIEELFPRSEDKYGDS